MRSDGHKLKLSASCFLLLAVCSCAHSGAESARVSSPVADRSAEARPTATPSEITDPTCCGLGDNREGLARAWRQFTEGGQFRLARAGEMNFPDSAKREWASDWESVSRPYQYAWGKRGFETDKDHLVAIVVDTRRSDAGRFSLVIFSSLTGSDEYRPYWLYRNRDLSRTMISAPSGHLMLAEYGEDGSKKSCDVFWNPKSKQYYCKLMRA
jgi:hypothetical protein